MTSWWRWVCWVAGAAIVVLLLWRVGAAPFVDGVRALSATTLAAGVALAVPITVANAWRWQLVARGLGVGVALGPAVASCYRAQLLNTVLPGGVLGDVHRGVRHGRLAGATGRGLRAVFWERTAGQVVLGVVTLGVLLLLPSPVRPVLPWVLVVAALSLGLLSVVWRAPAGRLLTEAREDVRLGLLSRASWPGVMAAATVAVAGHVATYLLAARAVGVTASVATLLPVVLLVLVAAGLPTNVAGWGPREGVAAWAFGAAGLGVEQGVATSVAYGAMVLVATLPGAVVLAVGAVRGGVRAEVAHA